MDRMDFLENDGYTVMDPIDLNPLHKTRQNLERELRAIRDNREGVGEELKGMRMMLEDWEREKHDQDPALPEDEDFDRELRRLRQNIELMEEREATLDLRIIELDNDLARSRSDIRILEESVDEQLGLR